MAEFPWRQVSPDREVNKGRKRALDNGCLACLFIEIKGGDFSSELQTAVFPLHQRQMDTPWDTRQQESKAAWSEAQVERKTTEIQTHLIFFSPFNLLFSVL